MWYKKSNFGGGIVPKKSGGVTTSAPLAMPVPNTPQITQQQPSNTSIEALEQQIKALNAKVDKDVYYDIEGVYTDANDLQGVKGMTDMLQNPKVDPSTMTMEQLLEPARQPDNVIAPTEVNKTDPDQHMRASIDNNVPAPGAGWQDKRIPDPYHPMTTPYQK